MSDIKNLNILLKPNSNENNKKILDYLHKNQKKINSNDIIIKPLIMNPEKIDEFVKIGVSNLPSLLYNGKIIYGVNEMIKYINQICKADEKPAREKNDDDNDIYKYMMDTALENDDELEPPISDKELRNNRFSSSAKKNKTDDTKGNANIFDDDDDIMSKYWQNSEETDA